MELLDSDVRTAKKYKDSTDDEIADNAVKQVVNLYRGFKNQFFKDPALETAWSNVKLNPQILNDYPDLKTYLLRTADLNDTFWRWGKQKGTYPLYDEINEYFKVGKGIYDQEIGLLEEGLNRGEMWNYDTVKLMRKRLDYLKKNNH